MSFFRRQKANFPQVFLLIFLIFLGFSLINAFKGKPGFELSPSLPQDPYVKVYFNHNPASKYEEPYRHFTRLGDNLEQKVIEAINQAESTIDVAVMEFRLPQVAEALIAKQKSGVKVRLIVDNKYNKSIADYTSQDFDKMSEHDSEAYEELKRYPADAIARLRLEGIEIKDDTSGGKTKGTGIMHHKFVIVDGKTTIISSSNFTTSDIHGDFNHPESRGNPNNLVIVSNNNELANIFTQEFNYMWQGLFKIRKPSRSPVTISMETGTMTIHFSPVSKRQEDQESGSVMIADFINKASSSIHIAVFVYSDQHISNTLAQVHQRGIKDIKILIDPDFYGQTYSKAYDALGVCPASDTSKIRTKIKVNPWQNPITSVGFPTSPIGDRGVHSKMAIIDDTIVLTGSQNWSNSGNYKNDETLIAIKNPTVAAHYQQEFNRLYETAVVGLKSLPEARQCF